MSQGLEKYQHDEYASKMKDNEHKYTEGIDNEYTNKLT